MRGLITCEAFDRHRNLPQRTAAQENFLKTALLSVLKSPFHPLGPTILFDHIVCSIKEMSDEENLGAFSKPPSPPLSGVFDGGSGGGSHLADVSKQQPPSPNPPLLPVVDKKVSKQDYPVDDGGLPTAILVDVYVH